MDSLNSALITLNRASNVLEGINQCQAELLMVRFSKRVCFDLQTVPIILVC